MNLTYWFDSRVFEGSGWNSFEMLYLPISLYFLGLDFRGSSRPFIYPAHLEPIQQDNQVPACSTLVACQSLLESRNVSNWGRTRGPEVQD